MERLITRSGIEIFQIRHSTNLDCASFYGFNAVDIANTPTATLDYKSMTTRIGAARFYTYNIDTTVTFINAWVIFSDPISHDVYASSNSTIISHNVVHYPGKRSSIFSEIRWKGYLCLL
ncbi:uncharacterized protein N7500_008027 [Penicillium coprophilum]|uniref:uncharacterized protein n=1 Tax=Penicillium coprophilum TaxID=36646 RepID=UPI002394E885|nr:uncharacterized protein N7500_008027 [Penicillium coprophilum]KAJ5158376.1 hypothetical protein N7500_008027 [Penicillium coprophilum]